MINKETKIRIAYYRSALHIISDPVFYRRSAVNEANRYIQSFERDYAELSDAERKEIDVEIGRQSSDANNSV